MKAESTQPLAVERATEIVIQAIGMVAPDVEDELASLDLNCDFFEEFELDSMDHANVMTKLWELSGITIAEREYASMRSVSSIAGFLAESAPVEKEKT
ncbi:MAG: acyl carrier protein [Acidimicrobiales bacterium]